MRPRCYYHFTQLAQLQGCQTHSANYCGEGIPETDLCRGAVSFAQTDSSILSVQNLNLMHSLGGCMARCVDLVVNLLVLQTDF